MNALTKAFRQRRVLVTGDTGFKGAWLAWWLHSLGADVHGLALPPATSPNLFDLTRLSEVIRHHDVDIRDFQAIKDSIEEIHPDLIFHLAAQAIVLESYRDPLDTFNTNLMGTVHLLEAVRLWGSSCAIVLITSDKCYENREWSYGYRENDAMGGRDPYSASKGCAELAISAYRRSFFPVDRLAEHGVPIASTRAGNVIGPGDWGIDRIIPDAIRALSIGKPVPIRNPMAVRPWQHVLEPLSGYLWLAVQLLSDDPTDYCGAWNFGPNPDAAVPVSTLIRTLIEYWGEGTWEDQSPGHAPHEANMLRLSIEKAASILNWRPIWDFPTTVQRTARGYKNLLANQEGSLAVREALDREIDEYSRAAQRVGAAWALDS